MSDWDQYDVDPGTPGVGRHRAEPTSGASLRRLLAPLAAVAAVAVVVVVLIVVRGHSPGTEPGPGVIVAPTITPVVTPTPSTSSTPSVALTHPPPTPTPSLRPTHRAKPAWRTAMAPVRVYNSTHTTGLAHGVAAQIAAKGWTVPVVGNVTATSSITTLYYSPNAHDAARHLAKQFPGIRQIRPNGAEQLDYHGLTLVLTADWHS